MKRHFYISDNLDELKRVEQELNQSGITPPQLHVLSEDDGDVERKELHNVEAVLKKDVVFGTELGAVVGVLAAASVLFIAYFSGLTETAAGWLPFVFLSIVVLGFCTWEGGLIGIQEPHHQFKRFASQLRQGRHVFIVDVDPEQETRLTQIMNHHPALMPAGTGSATPRWVVRFQDKWRHFMKVMP